MDNTHVSKKIAVIFHDSDYYSGATRSMIDIIDTWIINNTNLNIVAVFPNNKGSAIDYLEQKNIKILSCKYGGAVYNKSENTIASITSFVRCLLKYVISYVNVRFFLCNKIKKLKVDLIYSNTSTIHVGAWLKKQRKLPHIWHFREFGIEDQQSYRLFGQAMFESYINKHSDKIIFISKSLAKKYNNSLKSEMYHVIYDDVSNKYINFNDKLKIDKTLEILMVGRICEGKGQMQVIKAVNSLIQKGLDINLKIAGNGKGVYYDSLLTTVKENELQNNIVFLDQVKELSEYRKNADIGIIASRSEAFGRVTIEGMLSCMVMICADTGSSYELISNGSNGLIYEYNNVNDLASKIEYIYYNRNEIMSIGLLAFDDALKYTQGECAKEIYKLIEEALH